MTFRHVHVGAVHADDERPPTTSRRRHDTARDDPVTVQDGCPVPRRDPTRREPAGRERERRGDPRAGAQRRIGFHSLGIPEDVQ